MSASTTNPFLIDLVFDRFNDPSPAYQTLVLEEGEIFEWVEISVEFHRLPPFALNILL